MEKKHYFSNYELLTMDICSEYRKKAIPLIHENSADTGELRNLRIELQRRCGISEIQAINILRGFHAKDYCNYYKAMYDGRLDSIKGEDADYLEWLAEKEEKMRVKDADFVFEEKDI